MNTMNQNYDQQELAKFSSLAAQWWDITGELKTLHLINPLRLGYINKIVELKNKKVVDIGCGGGILAESMAQSGAKVTGIDLNKALIEVAKLHQLETRTEVSYLPIAAETLATTHAGHYDVVTCLEMLEHVPNPLSIVQACASLVSPGGHVFFSTLNRNLKSYLFAILGAEYMLKLLPKNTHDYAKFIRPSELAEWARQAGLQPKEIKGIRYHLLSKQFDLSDDISVNYILHAMRVA